LDKMTSLEDVILYYPNKRAYAKTYSRASTKQ
jgi:hypothetical protein